MSTTDINAERVAMAMMAMLSDDSLEFFFFFAPIFNVGEIRNRWALAFSEIRHAGSIATLDTRWIVKRRGFLIINRIA